MISRRIGVRFLAGAVLATGTWGTALLAASEEQSFSASEKAKQVAAAGSPLEVTAQSCSQEDIQAAVAEVKAAGGGVVRIPEGASDHGGQPVRMPDGISLIGAGQDETVISNANVRVDTRHYGRLDKPFRVSGLHLSGNSRLVLDTCHDFRVDHCTIESAGGSAIGVGSSHSCVIDHCKIRVKGSFYGITMSGSRDPDHWPEISKLLGRPTAVFVEDCEFEGGTSYHATVGHGAIHYVLRHCILRGPRCSLVDAHGPGYGPPRGTRCIEVYENRLSCEGTGLGLRGGGGVVFGNTISAKMGVTLVLESRSRGPYPVRDQVHDLWIWDNTFTGPPPGEQESVLVTSWGGTGDLDAKEYIQQGRDYFLRRPTEKLDGFDYRPYVYPHPLTGKLN